MFSNPISLLDGFPKVSSRKTPVSVLNQEDDTLAMTATVLLYSRVDDLKIEVNTYKADYHMEEISTDNKVYSFYFYEGIRNEDQVNDLTNKVPQSIKTIAKLPAHEKFLREQLKDEMIFIRLMPEENNVCIFTYNITMPMFHLVQSFIPKFFPVFKNKPLTEKEKTFLATLTHKVSYNYPTELADLMNTEEFRKFSLTTNLGCLEKKMFEKKVNAARASLAKHLADMDEFMRRYKETYKKYQEAQYYADGLEAAAKEREERTDLQNYLFSSKCVTNISVVDDNHIEFIVRTYLAPNHVEEWKALNHQKMAELCACNFFSAEEVKLLLNAIFSKDRCFKLKVCSFISMDYFGSEVTSRVGYNFTLRDPNLKDYVPNGHLHHHNCFGQNKEAILINLKEGDVIGAIECSIACTQRMNIHESFSFRPFVNDLLKCEGKCLVTKDGTEMTPREAVEYLKEKRNEQT